jgi:exoribonuclease R
MALIITEPGYKQCLINNTPINGLTIFNKKLFHGDTTIYNNENITLDKSNRSNFLIGGILKLNTSVQYTSNGKKPIYEFIPLNWRYPKFLVPSDIKNNCIKRFEIITDYFVVIQFKEWVDKYPSGIIYKSIGPITMLKNKYDVLFYYYPESPYLPNKFNTIEQINLVQYNIINSKQIYSIDPHGCKDIDDALSIDDINKKIGIHIADVNYTIHNLNLEFSKFSTIYAPHKVINMLSDELAYNYCSLIEHKVRPVISCWIDINTLEFEFKREFIVVTKNYSYDEVDILKNKSNRNINILFEFSKIINDKYKYIDEVKSSHEMVEIYMIFLNNKIAELLKDNEIIYRNQEPCNYAEYSYENKGHCHMNLKHYTHFTSPIRRIVDQYIHQILIKTLFDTTLTVKKLDVDKINIFEKELKKVNSLWNYLKVSSKITNGEIFKLKFIGFDSKSIEFKLLEDNITIYNKLFFDIIDEKTITIHSTTYELNKEYDLPVYVIDNIRNQHFPKLLIKF